MAGDTIPLAENIAFLGQFANRGRTLSDPIVQLLPLDKKPRKDEARSIRVLTFDEERRLAEVFALILAPNNKPSQVGAVCIEEQPYRSGFVVRFAANSGTFETEKRAVFHKIINAAKLGRPSGQQWHLLAEIVELHQLRILRRLRSKHGPRPKNNGPLGQPIMQQLHVAVTNIPTPDRSSATYARREELVGSWLALFKRLECLPASSARSKEGRQILIEIVLNLSEHFAIADFTNTLSNVRPKDSPWPNSSYNRVLRAYKKIAQYKLVADYLEYMVCTYGPWELQFASSGPYENHPVGAQPVGTDHGLYRRSTANASTKERNEFQAMVVQSLGKSLSKVETGMANAIKVHKKVHAEIQLLYHYAQHGTTGFPPRILCSNKEACYLCYLFITVHGQFHVTRSHGNFYSEWRLPRMDEIVLSGEARPSMNQVIRNFNIAIEERLNILLQVPRAVRPKPSESTIFSMASHVPRALPSSQTTKTTLLLTDEAYPITSNRRSVVSLSTTPGDNGTAQTTCFGVTVLQQGQVHQIQHGKRTKLKIARGNCVFLDMPEIRLEFTFESKEEALGETAFATLIVEWLVSQDPFSKATQVNMEDLTVEQDVPCSGILDKDGIVLHAQQQSIFMRMYAETMLASQVQNITY